VWARFQPLDKETPTMHHQPPARQRGVTLIEAAITLAIAAIAATIAAPGFQDLIARKRLEGTAAQLATDLQTVRTEAVARNAALRVSFHADARGSCYLIHTGAKALCSCSAAGPATCTGDAVLVKAVYLPAEQRVAVGASASSILFDPVHGTSSPAATARVTGVPGAIHHVVNVMGRVRTCSPEGRIAGYRIC
jgi:type IV fimbrial biogenesis protein FimT